jgi:hypothetical protein
MAIASCPFGQYPSPIDYFIVIGPASKNLRHKTALWKELGAAFP